MEVLLRVMQGSYAYLLIFQVLIVSGLILAFIWLVFRRMKELPGETSEQVAPVVHSEEVEALRSQLSALNAESEKLKKELAAKQDIDGKVKFLEAKLLEYEILQEEISSLSRLKLENEKLREKLVTLEGGSAIPAPSQTDQPPNHQAPPPPSELKSPESPGGNLFSELAASSPQNTEKPSANTTELEDLLRQIDTLTATPPSKG